MRKVFFILISIYLWIIPIFTFSFDLKDVFKQDETKNIDDLFIKNQTDVLPWNNYNTNDIVANLWGQLISTLILYISVFAIFSLILSWFILMISWWEEEKVKKAKNWTIWSLIWVILSISSYIIVEFISKLTINL